MSGVPQPHREADLIMSGAQSLGQGIGQHMQYQRDQAQLDRPLHPDFQTYIQRVLQGEDPDAVAAEARANPNLGGIIDQRLRSPQQPAAQGMVPDSGQVNNQPSLGAPGAFSPAGAQNPYAPQAPQGDSRPFYGPGGGQQEAPPQAQSQSLGALPPADYEQGGVRVSRPGAPQAQPQQPPRQPQTAQGAASIEKAFNGPARQYTARDWDQLKGVLPAIAAGQGRVQVARTNADARRDVEALKAEKSTLISVMRENGLNDRAISKFLVDIEGLDDKQQQAVLRAQTDLERARINAGAQTQSAGIRASSGGTNDELKSVTQQMTNIRSQLGRYAGADRMLMPLESQQQIARMEEELGRLQGRYSELTGVQPPAPVQGPTPPPGGTVNPDPRQPRKNAPPPVTSQKSQAGATTSASTTSAPPRQTGQKLKAGDIVRLKDGTRVRVSADGKKLEPIK